MSIDGRVCVVTGASRGLGSWIAAHLAGRGARLSLCARDRDSLTATAESIRTRHGASVHAVAVDVSDAESVQDFARSTLEEVGPAYAVINNASVLGPVGAIDRVDPKRWSETVAVNLLGVVHTMGAFVPQMRQQHDGVVLNVLGGGVGGDGIQAFIDAYVCSKAAVAVLTETSAAELADHGVRVNALSPGPLATELMRPVLEAGAEAAGDDLYATATSIYRDRRASAEATPDLLELLDFLLDDEARALTGRLLSVRWNPVAQLRVEASTADASRYRLRRIDGDVFIPARREPEDEVG
jgi:NAD(P)-dependent dehydrogenase (short-subunit alcohol dehydrogenase family)